MKSSAVAVLSGIIGVAGGVGSAYLLLSQPKVYNLVLLLDTQKTVTLKGKTDVLPGSNMQRAMFVTNPLPLNRDVGIEITVDKPAYFSRFNPGTDQWDYFGAGLEPNLTEIFVGDQNDRNAQFYALGPKPAADGSQTEKVSYTITFNIA